MKLEKCPLFYKDIKGNLSRNYYCSECRVGPFSEDDIRRSIFIKTGGDKQAALFCRKCYCIKFHTTGLGELPIEYKERENYIISGKALEDMQNNILKVFEHKENIIKHGIHEEAKLEIARDEILEESLPDIVIEDPIDQIPEAALINALPEDLQELNIEDPEAPVSEARLNTDIPLELQEIANAMKKKSDIYIHKVSVKKYNTRESTNTKSVKNFSYTKDTHNPEKVSVKDLIDKDIVAAPLEALKEIIETPESNSRLSNLSDIIDFEKMSSKKIINLVKENTGILITKSTKDKKSVIKSAIIYLKDVKVDKVQVEHLVSLGYSYSDSTLKGNSDAFGFEKMSSREIINFVKEKTGQLITISTKDKKRVIKSATEYLTKVLVPTTIQSNLSDIIDFGRISARKIINFVKEKTGKLITESTKNKKGVIKLANAHLMEANIGKIQVEQLLSISKSTPPGTIDYERMSSREIIAFIKEKTGKLILESTKNKKGVIKCAKCHLENSSSKIVS